MGSTRTSIEIRFRVFAPGSPPPPPTGPTAPGPLEDGAGGTGAITQVCGGGVFPAGGGAPPCRASTYSPLLATSGDRKQYNISTKRESIPAREEWPGVDTTYNRHPR